jgi:hypothetical protein
MSTLARWRPKPLRDLAFVLDHSVPKGWFDPALGSSYTDDMLRRVTSPGAVVPTGWPVQITEWAYGLELAGLKPPARVDWFLGGLDQLFIALDRDAPLRAWADVLTLARAHAARVFDAAYLELALRRRLPLATVDPTLTAAAAAAGVMIYSP